MTTDTRNKIIYSTYALTHMGHKKWSIISENTGDTALFNKNLFTLGSSAVIEGKKNNGHSLNFVSCGDEIYNLIRKDLIQKNVLIDKSTVVSIQDKAKNKTINKKNKIIQNNIQKKFTEDLKSLFRSDFVFNLNNIEFQSKFIEVMYIKLMLHCQNLYNGYNNLTEKYNIKSKFSKQSELNEIINQQLNRYKKMYELVIGCSKLLKDKNNIACETCCKDLKDWLDYIRNFINFNIEVVIYNYPELIFKSSYDKLISDNVVKLYNSQQNVVDLVKSTENYLGLVHTMLGSGKTTLVLPICGLLSSNLNCKKTKLIFCCPNEIVLLEVANMVYGIGINFGILIYNKKSNGIEYKWSSFCDKKDPKRSAILYICDIYMTRLLLEEYQKQLLLRNKYFEMNKIDSHNFPLDPLKIPEVTDYILMCDEVTKDADSQINCGDKKGYSLTTEFFIEIVKIAPPKIILMSATLPPYNQLKQVYDSIIEKHDNMKIYSFSSNEAKIGCSLVTNNGKLYAPHLGSVSQTDILQIIEKIKTNPLIGRFYNFEVILKLIKLFSDNNLPTPDITEMITNPSTANQINIQKYALEMLTTLSKVNSNMITLICKDVGYSDRINLDTIFTFDIDKFKNGTLIFALNPVSVALDFYKRNFQNDECDNIFEKIGMEKIIKKYNTKMELYKKKFEKDIKDKMKNTENIENCKNTSQILESVPQWDFPQCYQLYSKSHLEMINHKNKITSCLTIGPDDLPLDSCVSFDILTLLASGIGIYSTSDNALDDAYLKSVILLAKRGLVKFIFADSSIAYGTNLSVSDIIIIDDNYEYCFDTNIKNNKSIVDNHSLKTIFQMLGRAGRGGNLSYQAKIRTTSNSNLIDKIYLYCKDELDEGDRDEVLNIMTAFKQLW